MTDGTFSVILCRMARLARIVVVNVGRVARDTLSPFLFRVGVPQVRSWFMNLGLAFDSFLERIDAN